MSRSGSRFSHNVRMIALLLCLVVALVAFPLQQEAAASSIPFRYTITGSVNPNTPFGTVSPGTQKVWRWQSASIYSTPNPGYRLSRIEDNGVSMPLANPYVIKSVKRSHNVVFSFAPDTYTVTASVSGGSGRVSPASRKYNQNDNAVVYITPDPGYSIAAITDNKEVVTVSNPYVIPSIKADHDVRVSFERTRYPVNASVPGGHGAVNPASQSVPHGGDAAVDLIPDPGYHASFIVDNGAPRPVEDPYKITNVTEAHDVVVGFELNEYDVDAIVAGGHGTVDPPAQTRPHGSDASILLEPDTGYHVATVTDNGVPQDPSVNPYVIEGIDADHAVIVTFASDDYMVAASVAGGNGTVEPETQRIPHGESASIEITPDPGYHIASVTDNGVAQEPESTYEIDSVTEHHSVVVTFASDHYAVNADSNTGGAVSPDTQDVTLGGTASIDVTPDRGHRLAFIIDNDAFENPSSPYVIRDVAEAHDVFAVFMLNNYRVNAAVAGGHGSVTPETDWILYGDTATIDIVPDTGYEVASIVDNGVQKPVDDPYVIHGVAADHDVVVSFKRRTHTVNASIGGGRGSVNPRRQQVGYCETASISISPADGYTIAGITDNGEPVAVSNPYVIRNVTGDRDVSVFLDRYVAPSWYLAEGSTAHGFSTEISIENPNPEDLNALITFMIQGGAIERLTVGLPALSQINVNPAELVGEADFSTVVECLSERSIAVDRTMTWTGPGAASPDGHCSIGATSPDTTWYMPEGSSAWGFETWTLVQNPNGRDAEVLITYMVEGSGPSAFHKNVPANSRATFNMLEDVGAADASVVVSSSEPVVVESAMYRNDRREGQCSRGATEPADSYYLAEGTTAWGYTSWILVQNPNHEPSDIEISYMTPHGPVLQPGFQMPPDSRKSIKVNDAPGMQDTDFSTLVRGSEPIVASRAMYWDGVAGEACHGSIGVTEPGTVFHLPAGRSSDGRETWTLVQNPNGTEILVQVTYLLEGGAGTSSVNARIPGNSRMTFNMADTVPDGSASVMVACLTEGKRLIAERSMYWNNRGAGTCTVGGFGD
jgi:hypothetical protein